MPEHSPRHLILTLFGLYARDANWLSVRSLIALRAELDVDAAARTAVVEPGVRNLAISEAAARYGLFYAPDPSSQIACTIGGNVAENAGGPHCLKYGVTLNHVLAITAMLPSGEIVTLGALVDSVGVDLGSKVVTIQGQQLSDEALRAAIQAAG